MMAMIIKIIFHHLCLILDFVTQNHCVNLRLRHIISPFIAILVIIASKSHFTTCSFDHFCVDLFCFILLKLCGKSIFWLTFAVMRFYRILFYTFSPQFVCKFLFWFIFNQVCFIKNVFTIPLDTFGGKEEFFRNSSTFFWTCFSPRK